MACKTMVPAAASTQCSFVISFCHCTTRTQCALGVRVSAVTKKRAAEDTLIVTEELLSVLGEGHLEVIHSRTEVRETVLNCSFMCILNKRPRLSLAV